MNKRATLSSNAKPTNIEEKINLMEYDFPEHLSKVVVKATCNDVVLEGKKNKKGEIPAIWTDFIENIKRNNSIARLIKTDIRFKSKYGRNFVGYEIYNNQIMIYMGDENNPANQSIRVNNNNLVGVKVQRTISGGDGEGPMLLRIEEIYTAGSIYTLYMGGFAAKLNGENEPIFDKDGVPLWNNTFPWGNGALLEIPDYVMWKANHGARENPNGILSCFEFLNREYLDNVTDYDLLTDWYDSKDDVQLINSYQRFFAWELELDHTRVLGTVTQNEIMKIRENIDHIEEKMNSPEFNEFRGNNVPNRNGTSSEDAIIKQKLIIRAIGGADGSITVMNSNMDGQKHVMSLKQLTELAFIKAGYSMETNDSNQYENVSQTNVKNRGPYESTKEKVSLFTKDWKMLLSYAAWTYFNKHLKIPFTLEAVQKQFDEFIDFKIVSNLLQEENNDWRKTMELFQNGIISNEFALDEIYPELTQAEKHYILSEIKQKEMNSFNNSPFENENFTGGDNTDFNSGKDDK